mgnify:CR=1 FL=1
MRGAVMSPWTEPPSLSSPRTDARTSPSTRPAMITSSPRMLPVTVPPGAIRRWQVTADDLDGVVEYPRSIEGVRLALLFREIAQGRIKVSCRSVGDVDVAEFAHQFGGGGHRKAAGLSVEGSLGEVQGKVLEAARQWLRNGRGDGGNA